MTRRTYLALSVLIFSLGVALSLPARPALSGEQVHGTWTIEPLPVADSVEVTLRVSSDHHNMTNSSAVSIAQFRGITAAQMQASPSARFEIVRDAGTFQCEGYLKGGSGGGTFVFVPSEKFVSEMRSLGYDGLSSDMVFAMAVHDVSTAYVRDLHGLGIKPVAEQLIAMKIHGVSADFVRQIQSLGYSDLNADKLVAMRIHGVTPDFVRELKDLHYNPKLDELIAMKIHGVTSDMARDLRSQGYDASMDQMIAMRIHGASPEFMKEVKALGYDHPSIDQLITMRIHGVTPEFIQKAQSKGMRNLSIDQLVSMRIHGVLD
ncbi:MAG TPA: hypothetical protein VKZ53_26035 [Candidatus Angelobacter sp.]|nr:hypothetical protein [Candidatus Angelobacter sp.]